MQAEGQHLCSQCGKTVDDAARFCPHCGAQQPAPAQPVLTWEADLSLLTNPAMAKQFAVAAGLAGLIMALLLSFLMAVQGEWESVPTVLLISFAAAGGLGVLMVLVILAVFQNRMRMRFTLSDKGVLVETIDKRARVANRLATLAGVLGRSPGTTGAGMLAMSREEEMFTWRQIVRVAYQPRSRSIALRNSWRTLAFLACTPENYDQVAEIVRHRMGARQAKDAAPVVNPVPRLLGRTALVILAALPVFVLPYPFELDLFAPLLMLCFALGTVWLVPLFGWVVIALVLWICGEIVFIGLGEHTSMFSSLGTYRAFALLDGADWAALLLAAAGLAYLVVFSWRATHGRVPSALSADNDDEEDD